VNNKKTTSQRGSRSVVGAWTCIQFHV